jgi:hypothetical protein
VCQAACNKQCQPLSLCCTALAVCVYRAELLESPAPPSAAAAPASAAKKVLEAHRILVTARSLCSIDTSVTHTSGHCSEAGALAELRLAGLPVDVDEVKCLLLQSLVAALPLLDPTGGLPSVTNCAACLPLPL